MSASANGAAIPGISRHDILNLVISVPPSEKQKLIIAKLDALSEQTIKLESIYQQKLNALEELEKSVLAKAFRGEL